MTFDAASVALQPVDGLTVTAAYPNCARCGIQWCYRKNYAGNFSADEGVVGAEDFGAEFDVDYTAKFGKKYSLGRRYINYSAEDIKVDIQKLWLSASAAF